MKTFPLKMDNKLHEELKIMAVKKGITLHEMIIKELQSSTGQSSQKHDKA